MRSTSRSEPRRRNVALRAAATAHRKMWLAAAISAPLALSSAWTAPTISGDVVMAAHGVQWKQSSRGCRELLIGRNLLLLEQRGRCGPRGLQHGGLTTTPRPFRLWHDAIHRLAPCVCWRTSQWLQALSCTSDCGLYGCCNLWYGSCACYIANGTHDELRCEA